MENQERKHDCAFCRKSSSCGGSLGGHMRSHLIENSLSSDDQRFPKKKLIPLVTTEATGQFSRGLRENPNKSLKSSEEDIKCESESRKLEEDSSDCSNYRRRLIFESQLDDAAETLLCKRKRSNRKRRYKKVHANSSPSLMLVNFSPTVSDSIIDQQEQEEVALSLVILSGDKGNWGGTFGLDSSSEFLESKKLKFKTLNSVKQLELKSVSIPRNESRKRKPEVFENEGTEMRNLANDAPFDLETKSQFKCSVCKKAFPSYQALGGHRASHKKFNGCCAPGSESGLLQAESSHKKSDHRKLISCKDVLVWKNNNKNKEHECPVCFKVFPSGQALGGHKRSHLATAHPAKNNNASLENEQKPVREIRDFIDLNLPAPDDEDKKEYIGFKGWPAARRQSRYST